MREERGPGASAAAGPTSASTAPAARARSWRNWTRSATLSLRRPASSWRFLHHCAAGRPGRDRRCQRRGQVHPGEDPAGRAGPGLGPGVLGSKLEVAYSDQLREHLDPEQNLIDNVCGGQEFIEIGGRRRHAISYLGDFLFSARAGAHTRPRPSPGGEQNRAILARLFSRPANLLVLDEPTNDLDIETLELLEEILLQFDGTVLLVSHDRGGPGGPPGRAAAGCRRGRCGGSPPENRSRRR